MKKIYGMILAHNCGPLLAKAYNKIPKNEFYKIFITDDGSNDNTFDVANSLGVEVINSVNTGYGANLKNGLNWGFSDGADYIVEIHGDGAQFHPKATLPAIKFINQNYDFIIGSRFIDIEKTLELGIPKLRYYANKFLSKIDKIILRLPFSEYHTGFRIYSRKFFLKNYDLFSNDYLMSFEIIAYASFNKFKCAEVPVECDYINDHTSHSYFGATKYAIYHFFTLISFLLAKLNFFTGIFRNNE